MELLTPMICSKYISKHTVAQLLDANVKTQQLWNIHIQIQHCLSPLSLFKHNELSRFLSRCVCLLLPTRSSFLLHSPSIEYWGPSQLNIGHCSGPNKKNSEILHPFNTTQRNIDKNNKNSAEIWKFHFVYVRRMEVLHSYLFACKSSFSPNWKEFSQES